MAAGDGDERKPWTATHYILAALGGCLTATALIIIVSVVLSPGSIIFSVTHASHDDIGVDGGVNLKLTILANNTSHRAKVQYLGFFVVLTNSTSSTGRYTTDAKIVEPTFPFPSKHGYLLSEQNPMNVEASLHLDKEMVSSFTGKRIDIDGLTVVLTSEVKFEIGVTPTKIFDIRVSCPNVTFVHEGPKSRAQEALFPCDG